MLHSGARAWQMYTCVLVPLRIAFPEMFNGEGRAGWDAIDILIEWCFMAGVSISAFGPLPP